jgi:dethiobiotin synthetase
MKRTAFFITGTDTGVGKTVLTALLARYLHERGVRVAALKPICSGGRGDARTLYAALDGRLALDKINPWHFRTPIAPLLAARRERKRVKLSQVLVHIRAMQKHFDVLLIESAGGLLSPLGEKFDSRDLIAALRATPIVVCPNRLGAVNQVLLTLASLPCDAAAKACVVLISSSRPDSSAAANMDLLGEFFDKERIFSLPWLGEHFNLARGLKNLRVEQTLRTLARV